MRTITASQQRKAGAILSYISLVISNIAALIMVPLMIRLLGNAEYGLYQLIGAFVGYLTILDFGMGNTVTRYVVIYTTRNDTKQEENLLAIAYLIYAAISLIVVAVGAILYALMPRMYGHTLTPNQLNQGQAMFIVLIVNVILSLLSYPMVGVIQAHQQFIYLNLVNIIKVILRALSVYLVLTSGGQALSIVIVESFYNVTYFGSCVVFAFVILKAKAHLHQFEWQMVRNLFFFSFFIFLEGIINQIFWKTDQAIIGALVDTTHVAIYAVGIQISSYYQSFGAMISPVFYPLVSKMEANQASPSSFTEVLVRTGRIQWIILGLMLSGFILFGQMFIRLWAGAGYEDAYKVALITLIPVTLPLVQAVAIAIARAKNRHRFHAILYLVTALLNLPLTYFFVRYIDYTFAAFSTAIMLVVGHIIIMNWYFHNRLGLNIPVFIRESMRGIAPAFVLAFGTGLLVSQFPGEGWIGLIVKASLFAGVYGVIMWIIALNDREKAVIKGPLQSILNRLRPTQQ